LIAIVATEWLDDVGDEPVERFGFVGRKGWGFSIGDMALLGLTDTVYPGDGNYEMGSAGFRKHLVQISARECLALLK
jgi:hypothetical protein